MKKTLALLLALVLCLGLLAGCQETPVETTTQPSSADPSVTETTTEPPAYSFEGKSLDMHTQKDLTGHPLIDFIKETLGMTLTTHVKSENFIAQLTDKVTPSLVFTWGPGDGHTYGRYGAFVNLYDYKDLLPNFFARYEAYGDELKKAYETAPGELYTAPIFLNGDQQKYGWIYREDIFKELNLTLPTDWDSFLAVCKALKEKYPNSYPFTLRNLTNQNLKFFDEFSQQFGVTMQNANPSLDPVTNTYITPLCNDKSRVMLEKLRELIDLGYMDVAALSNNTAGWVEDMASGTSFITHDKAFQVEAFEQAGQEVNPDYAIGWWTNIPLVDAAADSYHNSLFQDYATGYAWAVTTRCADLELALRYLDWMYSDEGVHVLSWGIEGKSYEVDADGNKQFIEGFDTTNMANYYYLGYADFSANIATRSPKTREMILDTMADAKQGIAKPIALIYNEEEQQAINTYFENWKAKQAEYVQKFLLGQLELNDTNWAKFEADLIANGQVEVLNAYNSAHQRLISG